MTKPKPDPYSHPRKVAHRNRIGDVRATFRILVNGHDKPAIEFSQWRRANRKTLKEHYSHA